MEQLVEQLYNALFLGSIYALFAVGFALVFSVLDVINLAHPAVFMLGAFVALFCMATLGLPAVLALLVAFVVTGLFGIALDKVAFAPLRHRGAPQLSALISSLAVSLVLVRLVELRYGGDINGFPPGSIPGFDLTVGGLRLEGIRLVNMALSIGLMLALTYVVRRTRLGRELRALAENPRAARILGIDVDRAVAATFFISSSLGGVAGVLLALAQDSLYSRMGQPLELKAFTVMIVGGMGSLPGAVLVAYVLGIADVAALLYLPTELREAFTFGLLFLILVVRPSGLFGTKTVDRV